jgi:hypothetical protein
MDGTAALVIASVSALVTAGIVLWLFVWAARKDGEFDQAEQRRLGIRRKSRLGYASGAIATSRELWEGVRPSRPPATTATELRSASQMPQPSDSEKNSVDGWSTIR